MNNSELILKCAEKFNFEFPVVLKHHYKNVYFCYFKNGSMLHCGIETDMEGAIPFTNIFHNIKTYSAGVFDFLQYCIEINKMEIALSGNNNETIYKKIPFSYFLTEHNKMFCEESLIIKYCQDYELPLKFSDLSKQLIESGELLRLNSPQEITERLKINKIKIKTISTDEEDKIKKRSAVKKPYVKRSAKTGKPNRNNSAEQGKIF